jgi:hypothetical protein
MSAACRTVDDMARRLLGGDGMRSDDEAQLDSSPDPIELSLHGDGVELLDFSPEFVEAFTPSEIAFFAQGDEDDLV